MKKNNFKFIPSVIILAIIQLSINNTTIFYVDLLGALTVILLLSDNYTFNSLLIITIFSDLIGHWYIGTHLFAAVLLTFLLSVITNFFSISSFLHKIMILMFFYTIFLLIILGIDLLTHNVVIHWSSFILEIVVFAPIILKFLNNGLIKRSEDVIF